MLQFQLKNKNSILIYMYLPYFGSNNRKIKFRHLH